MIKGDQRDSRRQAILWDLEELTATKMSGASGENDPEETATPGAASGSSLSGHGERGGRGGHGCRGGRGGMKVSFQQTEGETKEDRDRRGRSATAPLVQSSSSNPPPSPVRKSVVLRAKELVRQRKIRPLGAVVTGTRTNVIRSKMGRNTSHTLYRVTIRGIMNGSGVGGDDITYRVMWDVERRYSDFIRLREILMTTLEKKERKNNDNYRSTIIL